MPPFVVVSHSDIISLSTKARHMEGGIAKNVFCNQNGWFFGYILKINKIQHTVLPYYLFFL